MYVEAGVWLGFGKGLLLNTFYMHSIISSDLRTLYVNLVVFQLRYDSRKIHCCMDEVSKEPLYTYIVDHYNLVDAGDIPRTFLQALFLYVLDSRPNACSN